MTDLQQVSRLLQELLDKDRATVVLSTDAITISQNGSSFTIPTSTRQVVNRTIISHGQ